MLKHKKVISDKWKVGSLTNHFSLVTSHSGFTLIELMVVVAIIAIMAAVGAIVYSQAQQNGRDSKRVQDVQESQKAVEQYNSINGSYPNNGSSAYIGHPDDAALNLVSYFQGNKVPLDPNSSSGTTYSYIAGGSCAGGALPHYIVCAKLENCGGSKCNHGGALTSGNIDGCQTPNDAVTPTKYYCVAP
jgi:prepilin-type N-terminal cleavage/methylation domain-containing protein